MKLHKHLALAFDRDYLLPFNILLHSVFEHNQPNTVTIHVIATGLTGTEQEEVRRFVTQKGAGIHFYELTDTGVERFVLPTHEENYLSVAIYYRLFFPFLVQHVERLLYIDVDTLVVGNLDTLFTLDLKGLPAAAVTDTDMPIRHELGVHTTEDYFNSGVLLIDIEQWKTQQISEKALRIIKEQPALIQRYPDQDALNIALLDNWYKLPTAYNLMRLYVPNEVPKRRFGSWLKEQKIVHFNGKKPWYSDCEHRLRDVYRQYARTTPFAGAGAVTQVKLAGEKRAKLRRSRLVEFYFDYPELVTVWRKLKKIVGRA